VFARLLIADAADGTGSVRDIITGQHAAGGAIRVR
jgi:hypothetical protein